MVKKYSLSLRRVTPDDAEFLYSRAQEGLLDAYRPNFLKFCPTVNDVASRIALHQTVKPEIELEFFITLRDEPEPKGMIALLGIDYINKKCEMSLTLFEHKYRRLALQAVWVALQHGFDVCGLDKIVYYVPEFNRALLNLLKIEGIEPEALLIREILHSDLGRRDVYRFSVFKEDLSAPFWKKIGRLATKLLP